MSGVRPSRTKDINVCRDNAAGRLVSEFLAPAVLWSVTGAGGGGGRGISFPLPCG